jgi:hypothetical protein
MTTRSRTRVGSTPDMLRISNGVSRPGIDPRIWCSYGYVLADSQLDTKHGDFVEVALLPSELEITCRVPQAYAGDGFGSNDGRLKADDEVLVVIPDGDPAHGGTIVGRYWNGAISLPDLVKNNPNDWVRVLATDTNHWIQFQGNATQRFQFGDNVLWKFTKDGLEIGDSPTDMMALASLVKNEISALRDTVNSLVSAFNEHEHIILTGSINTAGSPVAQSNVAPVTVPAILSPADSPAAVGDVKSDFVKSK